MKIVEKKLYLLFVGKFSFKFKKIVPNKYQIYFQI